MNKKDYEIINEALEMVNAKNVNCNIYNILTHLINIIKTQNELLNIATGGMSIKQYSYLTTTKKPAYKADCNFINIIEASIKYNTIDYEKIGEYLGVSHSTVRRRLKKEKKYPLSNEMIQSIISEWKWELELFNEKDLRKANKLEIVDIYKQSKS